MLTISPPNMSAFRAALRKAQSNIAFANVVALTRTAKAASEEESKEVRRVFDRPAPFTVGAFYTRPATKAAPRAEVGIKNFAGKGTPASKYLMAQITGGARAQKRSERALTVRGLMRGRQFIVPASGMKLDAYGNVRGQTMVRILSDLKASSDPYQNRTARSIKRNTNYQRESYFVPPEDSKLAPGVWVKRGLQIQPALLFVSVANYTKRFDFFGVGMRFAEQRFPVELARALSELGHGR